MNGKKLFPLFLLLFALALSSCSGPKGGIVCTVNCGGGGGSLLLAVTAATRPDSVPGTISILSFTANISGITITSAAAGNTFTITPSNPNVDLNKLLSDSVFLGQASPESSILSASTITIASAQVVYCASTSGVAGCNAGSIQTVTGGPWSVPDNALPTFPSGSTKMAMRLYFDLQNALVLNPAGTAVTSIDFTQALALEWTALPTAANLTSGQEDYIEDITGVVTNATSSSVTLQSTTGGTFTANIVTGTSNLVTAPVVGQVADMDVILNNDGTFTLLVFDQIDTTSNDWIEGVISYAPTALNQFQLVTTNFVPATTGSHIGTSLHLGDPVAVTISSGTAFTVDAKNLTVNTGDNFTNQTDTSNVTPGQVVAVRATSFTAVNGATPASATVNAVTLRYTRVSGSPGAGGLTFQFLPTGPYLGIQNLATTYITNQATIYDLSTSGNTVPANTPTAIRALYFGPPNTPIFYIAKVRQ